MSSTLFRHVRVFDSTGAAPFAGEVLVEGDRIATVRPEAAGAQAVNGEVKVIDGRGAVLMPGLVEAHAHLSWPTSVERFVPGMSLPPDDLVLNTARNARVLLDHGFTSAYSGGALGKSVEVVLKACIDSGGMPGPRLIASSIEREPPVSGSNLDAGAADAHGSGPESVRAFVKQCAQIGAKAVKFL